MRSTKVPYLLSTPKNDRRAPKAKLDHRLFSFKGLKSKVIKDVRILARDEMLLNLSCLVSEVGISDIPLPGLFRI